MIDPFRRGNERFLSEEFPRMKERFRELAGGQSPHTLLVACSDSRVVPSLVAGMGPGELFVVRNAGNLVPRAGWDEASGSALQYALEALGVRHVAVWGHSGCGAMQAVVQPEAVDGLPEVARWVRHAEPTRRALAEQEPAEPLPFAVAHNARTQLDNVLTHDFARRRFEAGELVLSAWVYDIPSGRLELLEQRGGAA